MKQVVPCQQAASKIDNIIHFTLPVFIVQFSHLQKMLLILQSFHC